MRAMWASGIASKRMPSSTTPGWRTGCSSAGSTTTWRRARPGSTGSGPSARTASTRRSSRTTGTRAPPRPRNATSTTSSSAPNASGASLAGGGAMPFTFKLSKRLALMKSAAILALLAGISCEQPSNLVGPSQLGWIDSTMFVVPESITLQPAQSRQFTAYGRTRTGDSVLLTVNWKALGGIISSSGLYSAGALDGDYPAAATLVLRAATGGAEVRPAQRLR